jgi:hypothetical protein
MRKAVAIAALIGFINCILAILLVFLTFNASEEDAGRWINPTLWVLAPPVIWSRLAMPGWMMFLLPFANAALYAGLVSIVGAVWLALDPSFLFERIELRWPVRKVIWQRRPKID